MLKKQRDTKSKNQSKAYTICENSTNPKFYWRHHLMPSHVDKEPKKHRWTANDTDLVPVLNNIAAAAYACKIDVRQWVSQCFETPDDAMRFLDSLSRFENHINSYWFYALLSIIRIEEKYANTAESLAYMLKMHGILTKQIEGELPQ